MSIVRVALDVPLATLFDYALPDGSAIAPGQCVVVPFGRKQTVGVVMEGAAASELPPSKLKPVLRVMEEVPPLAPDLLALLTFCSDYYHYPIGATVISALPVRLRSVDAVPLKETQYYRLSEAGRALAPGALDKRRVVQARILAALASGPIDTAQIRALSASAAGALRALLEAGWVESCAEPETPRAPTFDGAHTLTEAQQRAVDVVTRSDGYASFLLHGVTGSGKTEVYVHLMHHMLQQGGQVLLLVPEINLTPQLENYFRSRFPDAEIANLHSGLAEGERAQAWLRAQSGRARIVLGTRLAVFTPMPRLALIIVDEEHDSSYKQQDGLRYSARDVAIFRGSQTQAPVVLGSATPSLESWHNARSGRYRLLELPGRALPGAQLPLVRCLDISRTYMPHGISDPMFDAIAARMARGEQSLLFINRRGYAPVLMCTACGWLSGCPNCAGKLVLHLQDRRLRCHHCGHQARVPHACPDCGNADLQPVGMGTQRVEAALQERFPQARILRVDRDSTRNKGAWSAMRRQIHEEEVDILVGTQILAKGHDFPNLTLVGVLNPDGALYSANFRASETLYAQLAQVAGRAGRADKPGEVLVQTAFPDHPLFRALRDHDYRAWAETLLAERRVAGFPPFMHQALLRASGRDEQSVYTFLHQARERGLAHARSVEIYGVVAAAMPRRAAHFMAQLLVQAESRKPLHQFLRAWRAELETLPAQKLRWSLDIDPLDM
jgi:primosomal protein N' (replication factor Y)